MKKKPRKSTKATYNLSQKKRMGERSRWGRKKMTPENDKHKKFEIERRLIRKRRKPEKGKKKEKTKHQKYKERSVCVTRGCGNHPRGCFIICAFVYALFSFVRSCSEMDALFAFDCGNGMMDSRMSGLSLTISKVQRIIQ